MIVILDCGSQLTMNIARRVREHNVFCEILPYNLPVEKLIEKKPEGLIISGGPSDVNAERAPLCDKEIFSSEVPVLGICYGMQMMAKLLGGKVASSTTREYGRAELEITTQANPLFKGINNQIQVWMSHGDSVVKLPEGFSNAGRSSGIENASMWNEKKNYFAVQFHPEVDHTEQGRQMLLNFIRICGCKQDWKMEDFIEKSVKDIRKIVGDSIVIGGVSGGVDSTVASALMHKAIGGRFRPILINHGLMMMDEADEVRKMFKKSFGHEINYRDASKRFLSELKGVKDPEQKRKIIGRVFIEIFTEEAKKHSDAKFLMQGTLYPDVVESQSAFGGPTSVIKSHHNVGGLPEEMHLKLIEPFRYMFKDEVRKIGEILGLPKEVVWRHPFPGPGLAIRIIGDVTVEKLSIVRQADRIFQDELRSTGQYYKIWQAFAVLLPVRTVGVMGDERTYERVIALRAFTSSDTMTADWAKIPYDILEKISSRIINEIKGVNRVVYDISQKPPATMEWE